MILSGPISEREKMGYTIVYDRLFLRAEDMYIPICLYGSSNCTEYVNGREVLERSWDSFSYCDEMLLAKAETMMREVRARHTGGVTDNFKFRSKWLDDDAVIRFFENGIKSAVTIEEIKYQLGSMEALHAYLYCWPTGDERASRLMDKNLQTSEEIIQWTTDAKRKKAEMLKSGAWKTVYICYGFYGRTPKKVNPHINIDTPVIAKNKYGYVSEISQNKQSWSATQDKTKALVFANSRAAYLALPQSSSVFNLHPADKKNTAKRDWVLSVQRFGSTAYIHKLTSRKCSLVRCASNAGRRFASSDEALKWFEEKIRPRFPGLTDPAPHLIEEV